ncbi:MAG: glycosyltransferase family 2 protein [Candidatus Aenigmatarchaeota archaeon]
MIVAVMPAYNEEKSIADVIKETKKYVDRVMVIDDCSADNTATVAKKSGALVIRHKMNSGLGSSLRTGFKEALKMRADVIITIDADGQHDPNDIPKFIEKIKSGYDFVLGERNLRRYPFLKKFGNFFLCMATNFISGTNLNDTESGFRAFKRNALEKFYLKSERYQIAVEIIFEVGRNNLKTINVPISSPKYVRGVGVMDGFRNFLFLMHRRERNWISYLEDIRYVLRKWLY